MLCLTGQNISIDRVNKIAEGIVQTANEMTVPEFRKGILCIHRQLQCPIINNN